MGCHCCPIVGSRGCANVHLLLLMDVISWGCEEIEIMYIFVILSLIALA
jgi:hypothetical protein